MADAVADMLARVGLDDSPLQQALGSLAGRLVAPLTQSAGVITRQLTGALTEGLASVPGIIGSLLDKDLDREPPLWTVARPTGAQVRRVGRGPAPAQGALRRGAQAVSIRSRFRRLAGKARPSTRCRLCRGRPSQVIRSFRQDGPAAEPVPQLESDTSSAGACPGCGWEPAINEVVEIVIRDREELAAFNQATAGPVHQA
jgi:hypothetical protein